MARCVTTADFIRRARKKHGDRYDYSKVVYEAAIKKVTIICPEHDRFKQTPANHTSGHGCPECGGNKPITLDRFIQRARDKHGDRYDYSRVALVNVEREIEIVCAVHGPFFQRPMSHLKGFGCAPCGRVETAKKLVHSPERFLNDSRHAHRDKYDHSRAEYVNAQTKVTIVCPIHGAFEQRPANHIRGVGCSKCGDLSTAKKRTMSTEDFVNEARKVHGNRYNYSMVDFKTSHEKVEILCLEHGSFWQLPHNHTAKGVGCPGCAEFGFDPGKPAILYYVALTTNEGDTRYKIGITNLTLEKRFPAIDRERIRVVRIWKFSVGRLAAEREAEILYKFAGDRYYGPDILVGAGNTEVFTHDVLGLDKDSQEDSDPIVDADGQLASRPVQRDLKF